MFKTKIFKTTFAILILITLFLSSSKTFSQDEPKGFKYYRFIADFVTTNHADGLRPLIRITKETALKGGEEDKNKYYVMYFNQFDNLFRIDYVIDAQKGAIDETRYYNTDGYLTKAVKYRDYNNENDFKRETIGYFSDGQMYQSDHYDIDGKPDYKSKYSYTEDAKLLKIDNYDPDNVKISYFKFEWDANKRLIKQEFYKNGKLIWVEHTKYDDRSSENLPVEIKHIENGQLTFHKVIKYDRGEKRAEYVRSFTDGKLKQVTMEDTKQMTRKKEIYDEMEKLKFFEITYLDEKGNPIKVKRYEGEDAAYGFGTATSEDAVTSFADGSLASLSGGTETFSSGQKKRGRAAQQRPDVFTNLSILKKYFNLRYFKTVDYDSQKGELEYKDRLDESQIMDEKSFYRVFMSKLNIPLRVEEIKNKYPVNAYLLGVNNKPVKMEVYDRKGDVKTLHYFNQAGRLTVTEDYRRGLVEAYTLYYYNDMGEEIRRESYKYGKIRDVPIRKRKGKLQ